MIDLYVDDIYNALSNKLYFSALALSLALPDICGKAEYPDETSSSKRYIEWYDKYLGEYMSNGDNSPSLSGEVVYNLRNTFLHTGSPNIDNKKVKNQTNKLDRFILSLADDKEFQSVTLCVSTGCVTIRIMMVNVSFLCKTICDFSLLYYENNPDKFRFDFYIDTQDRQPPTEKELCQGDMIINLLNKKLEQEGKSERYIEPEDSTIIEKLKQEITNGDIIIKNTGLADSPNSKPLPKNALKKQTDSKVNNTVSKKKQKSDKREEQVRSFIDQHFQEKKYKKKKEFIIQAILRSKTKQKVNNSLMENFSSEDTGVIYKRISPLIASLRGK